MAAEGEKKINNPYSEDSIFQFFRDGLWAGAVTFLALGTTQTFSEDTSADICVILEHALTY